MTQKRIVSHFVHFDGDNDKEQPKQDIETVATFKFVRNLEAIFESIPQ